LSGFLSQEEIDALLVGQDGGDLAPDGGASANLNEMEKDALGEIGNISMGSAATALSQLLNQRVSITTPWVRIMTPQELIDSFKVPLMIIEVGFIEGLQGSNLLVLKVSDAMIIADLMMGGDGTNLPAEITELHSSAVAEAMNQMMGSAATSMSSLFNTKVMISTPKIQAVNVQGEMDFPWTVDNALVVVSFKMEIGTMLDSSIMQVLPIEVAKKEAGLLLGTNNIEEEPVPQQSAAPASNEELSPGVETRPDSGLSPAAEELPELPEGIKPRNLDLILDVPLKVSVVLGKTKKPIKEVLNFTPGSIVELEKLAEEPVDILVNGTPIARGEVVVISENFGVKITSIESPVERITNLKK
jgi:flagellar motor switch protein FliN/FliY